MSPFLFLLLAATAAAITRFLRVSLSVPGIHSLETRLRAFSNGFDRSRRAWLARFGTLECSGLGFEFKTPVVQGGGEFRDAGPHVRRQARILGSNRDSHFAAGLRDNESDWNRNARHAEFDVLDGSGRGQGHLWFDNRSRWPVLDGGLAPGIAPFGRSQARRLLWGEDR